MNAAVVTFVEVDPVTVVVIPRDILHIILGIDHLLGVLIVAAGPTIQEITLHKVDRRIIPRTAFKVNPRATRLQVRSRTVHLPPDSNYLSLTTRYGMEHPKTIAAPAGMS